VGHAPAAEESARKLLAFATIHYICTQVAVVESNMALLFCLNSDVFFKQLNVEFQIFLKLSPCTLAGFELTSQSPVSSVAGGDDITRLSRRATFKFLLGVFEENILEKMSNLKHWPHQVQGFTFQYFRNKSRHLLCVVEQSLKIIILYL
jgi:hypothetical protein